MQLSLFQLSSLVFLLPVTAALQTIYFGVIGSSAGPSSCIAWFSDSDPCNDGTLWGNPYCEGVNCNMPITILGHQNITFTHCVPRTSNPPYEPDHVPTGVSDDGTPALKCKAATNPPGSLYGVDAVCNGGTSSKNGGYVNIYSYCS